MVNFTIEQGSTFKRVFGIKNSSDVLLDVAINNQFRGKVISEDGVELASFEFYEVGDKTIKMVIPANVTETMPVGTHYYDIEMATTNTTPEEVTKIFRGQITIEKEYTV
jgi:hypothetical protein